LDCMVVGMTENHNHRMLDYNSFVAIEKISMNKQSLDQTILFKGDDECTLPDLRLMEIGVLNKVELSHLAGRSSNSLGGGDGNNGSENPIEKVLYRRMNKAGWSQEKCRKNALKRTITATGPELQDEEDPD
jgi:hypothetical protein